jgi:hypothetical protein
MMLLLIPNPSSHVQNPKTNKQLILQKIAIAKGHNYSCNKRNNTKCPNLHKHVGMLWAFLNCLNSKPRIQDRAHARDREKERERESARESPRERRVASAEVRKGFCEFYVRGGDERAHAKCRRVVGVRVSNPGKSGYHPGYVNINAAPEIKIALPPIYLPLLFGSWFLIEPSIPVLASLFCFFFPFFSFFLN